MHRSFSLLDHLIKDNLIDAKQAEEVFIRSQEQNIPLVTYLVKKNILTSHSLLTYCQHKFKLPVFDLTHYDAAWLANSPITMEMITQYHVLPLNQDKQTLSLGMSDPVNDACLTAIRFHTDLRIHPVLVSETLLTNIIHNQLQTALPLIHHEENDEAIITFVNQLFHAAIQKNASDIHIEPYAHHCRIRCRYDGLLHEMINLPNETAHRVITRLKIMANLNIAEKRLPQDGRIPLTSPIKTDIRLSTCPGLHGEKLVLRLLKNANNMLSLETLGLLPQQHDLFLNALSQPQGLIIVTGPTGSGKTITLYAALNYLNSIHKNIISIEDPIEIELDGINQVNINTKIGLDFSTILRSILRQDPDIIMIGEIRDIETARVALQAAQTGHLILSTMHTNNAIETLERLRAMGLTIDSLIHSISLILAQRLVRKCCTQCKQTMDCKHCYQGYTGRIGLFELLPMTEKITALFTANAPPSAFLQTMQKMALPSLLEVGCELVNKHITTKNEIHRVLGSPRL